MTIIKEYIDEAKSASKSLEDRGDFLRMMDDIKKGLVKVEYCFVHKYDRFARDDFDHVVNERALELKGVSLVAVAQPLDSSPESGILKSVLIAMNKYYSQNLSREVMKGLRENAYQGIHNGGSPPLGYDVDPQTKKYIINEKEAEIIGIIFTMRADGKGYGTIVAHLNGIGYRTKKGKPFGKNSIHEILRNEKYIGVYIFNRASKNGYKRNTHAMKPAEEIIRIPDAIPAIISDELWKKVQTRLEAGKHINPRAHGEERYFLTGKVYCGNCGSVYTGFGQVAGRNKTYYRLYKCVGKRQTKECHNKDIRKDYLEETLLKYLHQSFAAMNTAELADRLIAEYDRQNTALSEEYEQLKAALGKTKQKIEVFLNQIEAGLSSDLAIPRINALGEEKTKLEARLNEIEGNLQMPYSRKQIIQFLNHICEKVQEAKDISECSDVIENFVQKITVYEDDIKIRLIFGMGPDAFNNGGGGGS